MPRPVRLQCTWAGCPTKMVSQQHLERHIAEQHVKCEACERYFIPNGLKSHQRHCELYQRILRQAKNLLRSRCSGCGREIIEGQHYLFIPKLAFQTLMPVNYVPVRDMPDTEITDIVLCTPECFLLFVRPNELIVDVFGPVPDMVPAPREKMYEMYVEGTPSWLTLHEAAIVVLDVAYGYGHRVCELDGTTRQLQESDRIEIVQRARSIMDGSQSL